MQKLTSVESQVKYSINPKTLIEITLLGLLNLEEAEKKTNFINNNFTKSSFQNPSLKPTQIVIVKEDNTEVLKEEYDNTKNNLQNANLSKNTVNEKQELTANDNKTENVKQANTESENKSLNIQQTNIPSETQAKLNETAQNLTDKQIVAKLLRSLRNNKEILLQSSIQNFVSSKIENNQLVLTFDDTQFKQDLENLDNIKVVNDILKCYNITIKYIFNNIEYGEEIEDILKNKFDNIEII